METEIKYNELTGFYYTDSENEAKDFASFWGGSFARVINFPVDYFKVTI